MVGGRVLLVERNRRASIVTVTRVCGAPVQRHLRIRAVPKMAGGVFAGVLEQPSQFMMSLPSPGILRLKLDPADLSTPLAPLQHAPLRLFSPTRSNSVMTPFNGSQNDKKMPSTAVTVETGVLVPPQEQKSIQKQPAKRDLSWLIPPQEEMIDVAHARGEKGESGGLTVDSKCSFAFAPARIDSGK